MARTMKAVGKVILILVVAFVVSIGILAAIFYFAFTTKLQMLYSPDSKHHAELIRTDFIDRNYRVRVDGATVYQSPDFAPRRDIPFRETLVWDASGKIVIFEVGGHRVFGFDTSTAKSLSDRQLLAVELAPVPMLWDYHFEAEWPGIGRAKPPANSRASEP